MTQQQAYQPVARAGRLEIRRYPAHTVAEVEIEAAFDEAGSIAFRHLFDYIHGQVAMTAPVVQTPGEQRQTVAFVMPAGRDAGDLPTPNDPRVHLRLVPERCCAALRFSGRGNARALEVRGQQLLAALAGTDWRPVGKVRLAQFSAPYVPPPLRHVEVVVDVERAHLDG